ncbi:hypothetical protein MUG94_00590 [Arthrobacter gengyunqii]|uniref:Disulfide bond formation protein DsbA n=1 Tax=Arthrobacter gengyunqii TaxID=2886940 RepID=A0A9X1S532_9MICC|nr:hypothetical protein [Arthrobacter gengyunqii]MCC3268960.1 hypothetical protein [Arthrobacter gengyunqii]UOY96337.1 hypothetical protein MUG94_00590 [Arthrobacter gengyunqii]
MSANTWTVDFWLDPACPLTRRTARWLTSMAADVPLQVHWRVMSLSLLYEDEGNSRDGSGEGRAWPRDPALVAAAVQDGHGHAALGDFYDALWTGQDGTEQEGIGSIADALRRCALPPDLADGVSAGRDTALHSSHSDGVGRLAGSAGSPILSLTAPYGRRETILGPLLDAMPAPADAVTLWKATVLLAGIPGFREIRR